MRARCSPTTTTIRGVIVLSDVLPRPAACGSLCEARLIVILVRIVFKGEILASGHCVAASPRTSIAAHRDAGVAGRYPVPVLAAGAAHSLIAHSSLPPLVIGAVLSIASLLEGVVAEAMIRLSRASSLFSSPRGDITAPCVTKASTTVL